MGQRRHEGRDDLAGEHRFTDIGQIILLFLFLAVWILDSFVLKYSLWAAPYVSNYIKIPIAVVFFIVSGYLAKTGLGIVFGETRDTPGVIRQRVFGIVRHPIYLGAILLYLGCIFLTFSAFSAIVWIIIILFYHFVSRYEEKLLLAKFGKEYERYIKEVPMWIPHIKRNKGVNDDR